ncbi:MAG: iron-sulfur cluster carrier protein ApbC [Bdellovibrionota bacterium]
MSVTLDSVIAALRTVKGMDQQKDVMALGMIRDLKIDGDRVALRLVVTSPVGKVKQQLEDQIRQALTRVAGATGVDIRSDSEVPKGRVAPDKRGVPGVKHIIAVSSGKGGVGKSTVATNLAVALASQGHEVGLLDSDVYGPNIPTMMGLSNQMPQARMDETRGEVLIPLESYGVKVMSMGLLTRGDQPLVWRGPMLHSVVSQFLLKVDWGNLDYLVIDMPPGTGDVQLSLTQLVPVTGAVVVTTPQEVSLQDVRKAILMFEKVSVPILGIVENMSYFVCDQCDKKHEIFGGGGGTLLADKYRTRLLGQLPLATAVREGGDAGTPIVVRDPKSVQAKAFGDLARAVSHEVDVMAASAGSESGAPGLRIEGF